MTRGDVIKKISKKTKYSHGMCGMIIDSFFDEVKDALIKGDRLLFKDFMVFEVVENGPQRRRNPRTGEVEMYPAHKSVRCKVSKALKDAINKR